MCIITYTSTSLSLNNNSNIDSQPLKIPPEEDCKVEICWLTKDNTDKTQPFFLSFSSNLPHPLTRHHDHQHTKLCHLMLFTPILML